jgi:hypothetical protein
MLRDSRLFFGRRTELASVWGYLGKQLDVSIVAERRMGKSSLLWYIKEMAPNQLRFKAHIEYLDMEMVSSANEFFSYLAERLKAEIETARDLERAVSKHPLILCLDEFDNAINHPGFPDDFFHSLRALSQAPGLTLVVATKARLADLRNWGDLVSPFPNIFPTVTLSPMPDDEAYELLVGTAALAEIKFEKETLAKAIELGERRPWRLQLIGWHLVEAEKDWKVAEQRFHEALAESGGPAQKSAAAREDPRQRTARYEWVMPLALALTGLAFLLGLFSALAQSAGLALTALGLLLTALGLFAFQALLIWRRT